MLHNNVGGEEQPIKVDDLLKQVRSASPDLTINQETTVGSNNLEQAFEQFYADIIKENSDNECDYPETYV